MSQYKDTLTLYEELVASGMSDDQAKIQAHQLGAVSDLLQESIKRIDFKLEKIDKDFFWMRAIGTGMIISFLANAFWR